MHVYVNMNSRYVLKDLVAKGKKDSNFFPMSIVYVYLYVEKEKKKKEIILDYKCSFFNEMPFKNSVRTKL